MVDVVQILVEENSVSTGAGDFTLTSKNARRSFNQGYGVGGLDKFYYFITHELVDEWEHGTGHMSTSTTLVRDTVLLSSNANSPVNFSVGTKDVVSDRPGNLPNIVGDIRFNPQIFTAGADFVAGVTTSLTLSITAPTTPGNLLISFDAAAQQTPEYSLIGNVITFTQPIPVGVTKVEVRSLVGGGLFTEKSVSDIAITSGGPFNIVHGLAAIPVNIVTQLVNINPIFGYLAGEITYPSFTKTSVGASKGVSLIPNAINIKGRFGSNVKAFNVLDALTGIEQETTNTDWNLRVTAWS